MSCRCSRIRASCKKNRSDAWSSPPPRRNRRSSPSKSSSLERAVSRLIDAYQDGLLLKEEWEPRLTQARARLDQLREQEQCLAEVESQRAALRETLANLEQFAAEIRRGLEQADWNTRREILRTLIQRIQIEPHQVRITYRIRLPPFC